MNRLPSIRRWGVAALTGVTLFGGLSIVGAGVASAATTPTVSAAFTTAGATIATLSGTGTGTPNNITLTINGATTVGDQITLTLGCPTTGTASFATTSGVTSTDTTNWSTAVITPQGTACSTAVFTSKSAQATGSTLPLAFSVVTNGVSAQSLSITGTYGVVGLPATSFTVPSNAIVAYYSVSSNTPSVTLPASGTTAASPIQVNVPSNLNAADYLSGSTGTNTTTAGTATSVSNAPAIALTTSFPSPVMGNPEAASSGVTITPVTNYPLTSVTVTGLPTGLTASSLTLPATSAQTVSFTGTPTASGTYTVTVTADSNTLVNKSVWSMVVASAPVTFALTSPSTWSGSPTVSAFGMTTGAATISAQTLTVDVTSEPAAGSSGFFKINGASVVTTGASAGSQTAVVSFVNPAGNTVVMANPSVGAVLGTVTTIYGANGTADGTVAAEFENAFPAFANNPASGNRNVVLATDVAATNGSDALAASYLEGQLGTGLLITPATTLGADAKQALQIEGVTTVYVVGGPLAISPAVIAQIKALPAYNPGGLTQTGSNVAVVGPIYGADGTAAGTAAAIATYFGSAYGSASFPSAYSNTGIGAYNDTTGVGTTTAPSGVVPTAIVVASSDWQDALSIAPEAFASRFPIILNGPSMSTTLSATASATLTSLGVKQVIIVGGQLALQNSVETQIAALNGGISVLRIAGIDNTDTAAQIANFAWGTASVNGLGWSGKGKGSVIVSHGDYWTDALGAAALGGGANPTFGYQPILLTQSPTIVGQYTTAELAKVPTDVVNLTVLGGPLAMPSSTVQTLLAGL